MEALERAARALSRAEHASIDWGPADEGVNDPEGAWDCFVDYARAAVTAFLDPNDRALREALMPFMEGETAIEAIDSARAAIAALRDALLIQTNASEESK